MSHAGLDSNRDRPVPDEGGGDTGGAYQTVAVILAVIVVGALAYGLVMTAITASALFTS